MERVAQTPAAFHFFFCCFTKAKACDLNNELYSSGYRSLFVVFF